MKMNRTAATLVLSTFLTLAPAFGAPPPSGKPAKPLPSAHRSWSEAVTSLERTKKLLQADTSKDVNGHKAKAIADIEAAMQELRKGTQGNKH